MNIQSIAIEWDEDGCWLQLVSDGIDPLYRYKLEDPEQAYDAVKGGILPWLMERDAARREYEGRVVAIREDGSYRFECDEPMEAWVEMLRDNADHSRKVAKGE
jgi:hypothetical protein